MTQNEMTDWLVKRGETDPAAVMRVVSVGRVAAAIWAGCGLFKASIIAAASAAREVQIIVEDWRRNNINA